MCALLQSQSKALGICKRIYTHPYSHTHTHAVSTNNNRSEPRGKRCQLDGCCNMSRALICPEDQSEASKKREREGVVEWRELLFQMEVGLEFTTCRNMQRNKWKFRRASSRLNSSRLARLQCHLQLQLGELSSHTHLHAHTGDTHTHTQLVMNSLLMPHGGMQRQ